MRWAIAFLMLLMFSASFAVLIVSGDGGIEFAERTVVEKCAEPNVKAVYTCLGNVIRVVSSVPGQGSTFYKPDGKIVDCPIVAPTDMGAECLQMMTPNYCPVQADCGESFGEQVFPGQEDSAEQTQDDNYYIVDTSDESEQESEITVPDNTPAQPTTSSTTPTKTKNKVSSNPGTAADAPLDNFLLVALGLGAVSLIVLFLLFKNSIRG
ncbi:hypothetical protein KKF81_04950 [Candidatus Micrarchaeota archaeon]|nr:hypothetical protein [Candidatus Micrarchaeota archaeon]MBU1166274.1 hypothetical protein [Candidatus Micrarchaeota archaeon]MBU1886733.1 hypothetical protein [Candidatus Micrarchaeota archaeon]